MQNLKKIIKVLSLQPDRYQIIPNMWNYFDFESEKNVRRDGECRVNGTKFWRQAIENIMKEPKSPTPCQCEDMTVYSLLVRSFSAWDCGDEGEIEGGTFLKAIALLPLLKSMGINSIYLLPVFECSHEMQKGEAPSPYAIKDILNIEPSLHDKMLTGVTANEEFAAFIEAAHHLGIKVILDFVFRTCGRDNVLMENHPNWFYWIKEEFMDSLRSPEIPKMEQSVVAPENIEQLYSSPDMQRFLNCFADPPTNEQCKEIYEQHRRTGESINEISAQKLGIVTLTGFADTINDPQPPWTDVTYYKYYFDQNPEAVKYLDKSYPPFIAQDGVKCSVFPSNEPNYELWEYICDVIPFYMRNYNIDGARIDMGHALPKELNSSLINRVLELDPDFILWSEEFNPNNAGTAKEQGYKFILGDMFFDWLDYSKPEFTQKITKAIDAVLPVTASMETPDTPRIHHTLGSAEKVKAGLAIMFMLPNTVPMLVSGIELSELQPMNLGLMNTEQGKYILDPSHPMYGKLAFFDSVYLNWTSPLADEMRQFISQLINIKQDMTDIIDKKHLHFIGKDDKITHIKYKNTESVFEVIVNRSQDEISVENGDIVLLSENAENGKLGADGILIQITWGEQK